MFSSFRTSIFKFLEEEFLVLRQVLLSFRTSFFVLGQILGQVFYTFRTSVFKLHDKCF